MMIGWLKTLLDQAAKAIRGAELYEGFGRDPLSSLLGPNATHTLGAS
jgi:hypothetical protein